LEYSWFWGIPPIWRRRLSHPRKLINCSGVRSNQMMMIRSVHKIIQSKLTT
jgi:hypothetical protein